MEYFGWNTKVSIDAETRIEVPEILAIVVATCGGVSKKLRPLDEIYFYSRSNGISITKVRYFETYLRQCLVPLSELVRHWRN